MPLNGAIGANLAAMEKSSIRQLKMMKSESSPLIKASLGEIMDIKGVVTAEKILTRNDYITPGRPSVSLASRACVDRQKEAVDAETKASRSQRRRPVTWEKNSGPVHVSEGLDGCGGHEVTPTERAWRRTTSSYTVPDVP